jgi:hypothetical protein
MGLSALFCQHPLDESISYGSEDADFTLQLMRRPRPAQIVPIPLLPTDTAASATVRYDVGERDRLATSSRILFSIRRYWDSRAELMFFVAIEVFACLLHRQPVPEECQPKQWRSLARHLVGCRAVCP